MDCTIEYIRMIGYMVPYAIGVAVIVEKVVGGYFGWLWG